jgi:dihydroorotate dehydrogenase (NAD+) catalytic subunit
MVDLSVKIGDITLQNPVQPASGAFSWEYNDVIDLNRLGALVAKTICREPRVGNPTPRMAETEAGIIQSIGLPGKGIEYFVEHIVRAGCRCHRGEHFLPDPQRDRWKLRDA